MKKIDTERLINNLLDLCRIPGPSGQEEGVAEFIRKYAVDNGFNIVHDSDVMILKAVSTHSDKIFLSAHLDTVPVETDWPVPVFRKNGTICTDGRSILGGDDRAGVAIAIEMLHLCRENPDSHRSLEVVFTRNEELGCLGSRNFDSSLLEARTGFNLDGETPPGTVINRAPFKEKFRAVVKGKSAHAALDPEAGINAVVIAASIISKLPSGQLDTETTANTGFIEGGGQSNIVPDKCSFSGELRSFSKGKFEEWKEKFISVIQHDSLPEGSSCELEWEYCYGGYHVPETASCSLWFSKACSIEGLNPVFITSPGGGDSNNFNNGGLQNLVFGIGMHYIHTSSEYILEKELVQAADILNNIIFP